MLLVLPIVEVVNALKMFVSDGARTLLASFNTLGGILS